MARARPDPPRRRSRAAALVAALAVATALHALLLGGDAMPRPAPRPPVALRVRTVEAAPAARVPPPAIAPRAPAAPRVRPVVAPHEKRVAAGVQDDATVVASAGVMPVAATASAEGIPVYRTILPPPARMHYEMKRGMFSGSGDLIWKPAGERYELRLEASIAGLAVLTEVSTGLLDRHGIAPLRYTDQRLRRGISAANFQRDKGTITYSGPQVEYPLPPGAQDRLSWMLQLGGVLNAEPQHAAPGGHVVFFVTGARGDAEAWTFRYAGVDNVSTADGAIRAVRFTRQPRQTYDRLVEIWLAPARQHLPVRARFSAVADGEVFELLLRDIQAP